MWRSFGLICIFLALLPLARAGKVRDANGGTNCAVCTVLVGIVEQLAQVYDEGAVDALERLCSFLPEQLQAPCRAGAEVFAPYIAEAIYNKETPDVVCHAIGFCKVDPGHQACHIFPPPKRERRGFADICDIPGIKEICDIFDRAFSSHLPAEDLDKDGFSTMKISINQWSVLSQGLDSETGLPYEDVLCNGTEPRGMILFGDSIGAHFHLPPQWFEAKSLNPDGVLPEGSHVWLTSLANGSLLYANVHDRIHPLGHMNNTFGEVIKGPVDSIYMRLRERNRCNHRDYQNIGVNGGRSGSMNSTIVRSLVRNRISDYPAIVNIELVGNDVCNGHPDTLSHMTKPKDFRKYMLDTLQYLRAFELNDVLKNITATSLYKNFKLIYQDIPIDAVIAKWEAQGGHGWELIEPVDGFHINQLANALSADYIWEWMEKEHPELLGKVNLNNDRIKQLFGDQGGY
uniref:Saposin B-type domain-containing protein n=1 Tax=Branchiostoma floridae TaxID=7739 RepID=C3ZBL3_BRAFL|eukprot:XP_002594239.1 hypothetical protein BRAFLDRAFT_65090 [Branchiostoma floridae]